MFDNCSLRKVLKSKTVINSKYKIHINSEIKPVIIAINFDLLIFMRINLVISKDYLYEIHLYCNFP